MEKEGEGDIELLLCVYTITIFCRMPRPHAASACRIRTYGILALPPGGEVGQSRDDTKRTSAVENHGSEGSAAYHQIKKPLPFTV